MYVSRGLGYTLCEYYRIECPLNDEQQRIYDQASDFMLKLRQNVEQAIALTVRS